jgi:hypothetical protein
MTPKEAVPNRGYLYAVAALYCTTVLNELLPVVFGTGERASWDWSLTYVTLRWILVPLTGVGLCVIIVVANTGARTSRVASILIALAALGLAVFLWAYPWPFFVSKPHG